MAYGWMAAVYGILLSVMNTFNARLSELYGNWGATVMIHLVGLAVLTPPAFTWGKRRGRAPWYLYSGGLIGIVTVVFVNVGVSGIGVTANLVLMLLGQVACSAMIDHFGFFGARICRVNQDKIIAFALMLLGCAAMLLLSETHASGASITAAALSLLSGCSMVLSRIANAKLAALSGVGYSTVMNYVTGLAGSLLIFALMGMPMHTAFPVAGQPVTVYLGGALGAAGILLCNMAALKLPALQMSVIVFVGQVFSGMGLDALAGRFSAATLAGGLLVAAGLYFNTRTDAKKAA